MGIVDPKKVLKPTVDYVPLAKVDFSEMKEDVQKHGSYLLLLLLHGGRNYRWTKEELADECTCAQRLTHRTHLST